MVTKNILILGGAGFIGSHITEKFVKNGFNVTVIDGLLAETSANIDNLNLVAKKINLIKKDIRDVKNLPEIVKNHQLIIDCLGWTFHVLGLENPIHDLKLNAESHLYLLKSLKDQSNKTVIYLGSRGQYGNPKIKIINENTPLNPEDTQGIHKLTSELYFRLYSKIYGFNAISLRFPNTFGPKQPKKGSDIGLVGLIIKDILNNQIVEIYGSKRKRNLIFVNDLVEIIFRVSQKNITGFHTFNISGQNILIEEFTKKIIKMVKQGSYKIKDLPDSIKNIDVGSARVNQTKLKKLIGQIPKTNLFTALQITLEYFKISQK